MFSNQILLVVLGLILLMASPFVARWAKSARAHNIEESRKKEEELEAEAHRKAKQLNNFRKQRFIVYIRERDGRKSAFEALLISVFLKMGIVVEPILDTVGRKVMSGDTSELRADILTLVGTSWVSEERVGAHWVPSSYESNGYEATEHTDYTTHCDYRVFTKATDSKANIIAAGSKKLKWSWNQREEHLVQRIVDDLIESLPESPEVK